MTNNPSGYTACVPVKIRKRLWQQLAIPLWLRWITILICICMIPLAAAAQPLAISSSRADVNMSTTRLHKVFAYDGEHYYVIKFFGNQYHLQKLDKNLDPLAIEPIKLFQGIKTFQLETVVHFCNELYVFFSLTRIDEIVLYYQKIDKNSLKPYSQPVELYTIHTIKGAWASFFFALSYHETKLLIACRTKLTWSREQHNEYYVYSEGLNLVWKKKDTYEFRGQGPRDNIYVVDEIGNVAILSLMKDENIISLIRKYRNLYSIYRYTHEGNDFNEYPVTLEKNYIRGINIVGGEQGELICAGLYSETFDVGIRGTFFFKIDPATGLIYDRTVNAFDNGLLSQLAEAKEPMLRNLELINYYNTDMVLRSNGRIIVIAEQVFEQMQNTYNNLLVTCYDPDGRVYWTRVIRKKQDFNYRTVAITGVELHDYRGYIIDTGFFGSEIENYCSYALMAPWDRPDITLIYNDHIRNLQEQKKLFRFNQPRKSYLLAVTLDEFGNMTRTPLVTWKKKARFPEPIRYYDTHRGIIVIPAFRFRDYSYYRIGSD